MDGTKCSLLALGILLLATVTATADATVPPGQKQPASNAPSSLQLVGANTALSAASVPISVLNQGSQPIRLQRRLRVERLERGMWRPLANVGDLYLRSDCRPDKNGVLTREGFAAECITVEKQSTLQFQPWLGTYGDAQCICEKCVEVGPGTYRYVARFCASDAELIGRPFVIR
jgi:hypothetical protein